VRKEIGQICKMNKANQSSSQSLVQHYSNDVVD